MYPDVIYQLEPALSHYTIMATLNPSNHTIICSMRFNYFNSESLPMDVLVFNVYPNAFRPSGYIAVDDVHGVGGEKLQYQVEKTVLSITLPEKVFPGLNYTVTLDFKVKIPPREYRFGYSAKTDTYMLGNWFPILAVYDEDGWHTYPYFQDGEAFYSEVAIYDVSITVPEEYVVAASGWLTGEESAGGYKTYHFHGEPIRDFAFTASKNYKVTVEQTENNVTVKSYYFSQHERGGKIALHVAKTCIELYGRLFGEYPYPEFTVAETSLGANIAGMEYPTLIMIDHRLYNTWRSLELVIAHETGHQWWYGVVGNDQYMEPWLDEGLTNYCENLFFEYQYGPEEMQAVIQTTVKMNYLIYVDRGRLDQAVAKPSYAFGSPEAYFQIVYNKGAWIVDMLRYHLGDEKFFKAMSTYYQRYKFKVARISDFIEVFNEVSGEDLSWFFEQWLYNSGIPKLGSEYNVDKGELGYNVSLSLFQLGSVFKLKIPIVIYTEEGSRHVFHVWFNSSSGSYSFIVRDRPTQIIVDEDNYILKVQVFTSLKQARLLKAFAMTLISLVILLAASSALWGYSIYKKGFEEKGKKLSFGPNFFTLFPRAVALGLRERLTRRPEALLTILTYTFVSGASVLNYLLLGSGAITWFMFVLGGLILLNMHLTIAYRMRDEIATYSALGGNPSNIAGIYISGNLSSAFIGGVLGVLWAITAYTLKMYFSYIRVEEIEIVKGSVYGLLFCIVVSLVSAIYPAVKVSLLVTPSILRIWKLPKNKVYITRTGDYAVELRLPFRFPIEWFKDLVTYVREKYNSSIWMRNLKWKCTPETAILSFDRDTIDLVSGREGTCNVSIIAKRVGESAEWFMKVQSKGTIYARNERIVHQVADLVRKDILEWFCLK